MLVGEAVGLVCCVGRDALGECPVAAVVRIVNLQMAGCVCHSCLEQQLFAAGYIQQWGDELGVVLGAVFINARAVLYGSHIVGIGRHAPVGAFLDEVCGYLSVLEVHYIQAVFGQCACQVQVHVASRGADGHHSVVIARCRCREANGVYIGFVCSDADGIAYGVGLGAERKAVGQAHLVDGKSLGTVVTDADAGRQRRSGHAEVYCGTVFQIASFLGVVVGTWLIGHGGYPTSEYFCACYVLLYIEA